MGRPANGRTAWTAAKGKTMDEVKLQVIGLAADLS
jgi:hypothetical protein